MINALEQFESAAEERAAEKARSDALPRARTFAQAYAAIMDETLRFSG